MCLNDIHVARAMARERLRRLRERSAAARKPASQCPAAVKHAAPAS